MAGGDLDVRLPESSDEFGAWAASFNMMADSLQTKIGALEEAQVRERRFVSDVAHELRTPVAALVGEVSLIEARLRTLPGGTLPPDSRRALELISIDIGRLHRLIEELLEISRIDAGAAEIEWTETKVVEFLGKMMAVHSFDDVQLQATKDMEGLVVLTDRRLLERILLNLVENAHKHGRPPVEIELGAEREREDGRVWITVTDHGVGIAPADLPHIFDRFYKADPSRSASGGSGLGLAIAWETARLLGGSLSAESGVGDSAGARFTLRLPVRIVADSDTIVTDA
jgi:two-component system sensor histidine kinase MtrB